MNENDKNLISSLILAWKSDNHHVQYQKKLMI